MRKGLDLIQSNPEVKELFNCQIKQCMNSKLDHLKQEKIVSINHKETDKSKRIIYDRPLEVQNKTPRWRPFQIAFFF